MKKLVSDTNSVLGRYEPRTRDDLIDTLDRAIAALPEGSRAGARFEIDIENYPYDDGDYPKLFIKFDRPETDEEEAQREASEARSRDEREKRDKAEFERLSAKFAKGG